MDEILLRAINKGLASPVFDSIMVTITHKETWIAPLTLLIATLIYVDRRRGLIAFVTGAIAVGIADPFTFWALKPLVGRMRPCVTLEDIRALVSCAHSFSFPSNHAVNSFAIAGVLGAAFRPTLWLMIPVAALVSFSRVAVGVHYPSDVIVGAIIGFLFGWGLMTMVNRFWPDGKETRDDR